MHGFVVDPNDNDPTTTEYAYLAYILNTGYSTTLIGDGGCAITKAPKNLDAEGMETKNYDQSIAWVNYQGLAQAGAYLYTALGCSVTSWRTGIQKIAKATLADPGTHYYFADGGSGTPQGITVGNDNSANHLEMVYAVAASPNVIDYAYIANTGGCLHQLQTSDLTIASGKGTHNIPDTLILWDVAQDTSNYDLYVVGTNGDANHLCAKVVRLTQNTTRDFAINSWVAVRGTYDLGGLGTGASFYALDVNHDPSYVWAVGWAVHGNGLDEGDILLAKILKNNGSNVMEFTKVWRITTSYDTSFRGSGVIVDDKYVYVSTWHLPHQLNLATNEVYDATGNIAYILKLDKAVLEGGSPETALIWAKAFDSSTAGSKDTGIAQLRDGGDGFLYAGIMTNAFGSETYRCPAVVKIFKETGRTADYQDVTPKFKERARNSDITIAAFASPVTSTGVDTIRPNARNGAAYTPVWTNRIVTHNQRLLNAIP
jgi:hypothetical protein